jgi:hypothetical protein
VLAGCLDHLWQSVLVLALLTIAAALVRGKSAIVRLGIWRIAALKFLVPFHALFVIGGWMGYPIRYAEDTVPERLVATLASWTPYFTPAQSGGIRGWPLAACFALVPLAFVPSARRVRERLRTETTRSADELARVAQEPDSEAPGLGFVFGMLFAAVTMVVVATPVLAGAVADRLARHDMLLADSRSLFAAGVSIQPAAPGMGQRVRVTAAPNGVFVRNASIQDLTALSYGVTLGYVWSDHFIERGGEDWFTNARYDVRIAGAIHDPDRFDTYALRIPVTRVLAERYHLEIYVNDRCQPPCGRYGVNIPED